MYPSYVSTFNEDVPFQLKFVIGEKFYDNNNT